MTHTPGPWTVTVDRGEMTVRVVDGMQQPIASMWLNGDDPEANARLIAAAPDMLEALREIMRLPYSDDRHLSVELQQRVAAAHAKCRAAVAKATGSPIPAISSAEQPK